MESIEILSERQSISNMLILGESNINFSLKERSHEEGLSTYFLGLLPRIRALSH